MVEPEDDSLLYVKMQRKKRQEMIERQVDAEKQEKEVLAFTPSEEESS